MSWHHHHLAYLRAAALAPPTLQFALIADIPFKARYFVSTTFVILEIQNGDLMPNRISHSYSIS